MLTIGTSLAPTGRRQCAVSWPAPSDAELAAATHVRMSHAMAKFVHEIMNPELFSVEPRAPRQDTLEFLMLLGISGCPVIDEAGKMVGVVTIRDLIAEDGGNEVIRRISEPVLTIDLNATVEEAGKKLSEYHAHRLVVTDDKGRAVGLVSAVDLVAALVGSPVVHPKGFPHTDTSGAVAWSDAAALEPENSEEVPNAPGVLVLIYSDKGRVDLPVWVEVAANLRARVDSLVSIPQADTPSLAYILARDHGHLHFRVAAIEDEALRTQTATRMRAELRRRTHL